MKINKEVISAITESAILFICGMGILYVTTEVTIWAMFR